jgi:branched-chain amino acid transport system substrate-binding protein
MPLQGSSAPAAQEIVNGEKLALADAGGRAGPFKIGFASLDDANPATGRWDPGITATDAKTAAQDTSTIAYLGDYNSAATAVSLPLINAAGILQVSPGSPYIGLTSTLDAGQDEPYRFYPSGRHTFGRLVPGDAVEAGAQAQLMQALALHSVFVLDDQDPFEVPLADLVATDAQHAGIAVSGHDSIATPAGAVFSGEVEKILARHVQAVFLAGSDGPGAVALWRQLHAADPRLVLLGSSTMATDRFAAAIGAAAASTYLTTPALAPGLYPRSAPPVLGEYRRRFGSEPSAYALVGYETMSVVLTAIRSAGARGNDRQSVINRFLATRNRESVLGRYSMQTSGEPTLTRYGVDRVLAGRLEFLRAFTLP